MTTMQAVMIREHGGLEALRLEEVAAPEPGPGEVQVAIRAAALNHLDLWVRRGVPGHRFPLPMVPGCDGAGVISGTGAGVAGLREGDEVVLSPGLSCGTCEACSLGHDNHCREYGILGETRDGTNAAFVTVPARCALRKPAGLSFELAAALPLTFLTAWTMLVDRAGVRPADTVLVLAAGSGIGTAAIQVARLFGATVLATAGSADKRARARDLGADHVIDHSDPEWGRKVLEITGRRGVDVAIEHVGAATFATSLRVLGRGGRLVTCGATSGAEVQVNLRPLFFKNLSILGSTMGSRGTLHRLLELAEQRRLQAVIDRELPLSQVREAHRLIEERAVFGKLVLRPGS